MLCLIEFGLNQLLGLLALIGIVATVVGHFIFGLGGSKKAAQAAAITTLESLVSAQGDKIRLLDEGLKGCKAEHAACELRVNRITAFNLRLQAREAGYQKSINRLEHRSGIDITDWNDVSHAPEDPSFR